MSYLWTMKDGTKIEVDDMTEAHAKNCLKLLMRRNNSEIQAEANALGIQDWESEFWEDEYRYGSGK